MFVVAGLEEDLGPGGEEAAPIGGTAPSSQSPKRPLSSASVASRTSYQWSCSSPSGNVWVPNRVGAGRTHLPVSQPCPDTPACIGLGSFITRMQWFHLRSCPN